MDFKKLRSQKTKPKTIDPVEIFRRLPKPPGINDLFTSQSEILKMWFDRRNEHDTVLKLHTGGGKTLVGLLMAQSTLNELNEPVLYLAPTKQLVQQTLEKAEALGISAVPYEAGRPLNEDFINGHAIMVGTYKALFNGKSKFGIRGNVSPQNVAAVILDDAHAAFSVVRDSFTLDVKAKDDRKRYEDLVDLFRKSFREIDKLGTLEDIISGSNYSVLEVPYWAWHEQLDTVRSQLKSDYNEDKYALEWPLLRDQLHLCHALISKDAFTITPILPLVNSFPSFSEAPRRIYMSATIADDSEIIRTFDSDLEALKKPLQSRSLAGISERMILIPELMNFKAELTNIYRLLKWTTEDKDLGAAILVSSDEAAKKWSDVATIAKGPQKVEDLVIQLQKETTRGPVVFANRYDGIDLPGDSCRLLVMSGLPTGTSNYELFRASTLYGATSITRMMAQRIEQGIGRGARGAGDHCVVLLAGSDISGWIAKKGNFDFLTTATKAQLDMGIEVSKEVKDLAELATTIKRSFDREKDWTEYHAETLAEFIDEEKVDDIHIVQAEVERKAINLWADGYYEKSIAKIEQFLKTNEKIIDAQTRGWFEQTAARIADKWDNKERAEDLQRQAYSHNRNLIRPQILPPYRPLPIPLPQAEAIVKQVGNYRVRLGYLKVFEEVVSDLHPDVSANRFEEALCKLANMIGLSAERHDIQGEGPDILWLLPEKVGLIIEAKSRKKNKNALTKEEHGQLLVAEEWFKKAYTTYRYERVSVHPQNLAVRSANAESSYALTYDKLSALVSDARALLRLLCESQLAIENLEAECNRLLSTSSLRSDRIVSRYLVHFVNKN